MKKKLIVTILIIVFCITACQKVDYDLLKLEFDSLLNEGNYTDANTLYIAAEDERIDYYNNSLDTYSETLIDNALNKMSIDEVKVTLGDFLVFDYTNKAVQKTLDDIIALEISIEQSTVNYNEGMELFTSREFDAAYEKLTLVEDFGEDYQSAQAAISILDNRSSTWEDTIANNLKGRNPSVNSLAYKDGYVYFPVDINDVHSIVKHNYVSGETRILPIIEFVGTYHINGINVIGDYIYFIAGEELGRGTMLETPYNIYEMKTDGTGLTMVKSGDYFDLLSHKDTFYALSYSKGIVKMDKNLRAEEVISDKWIIEMQVTDNGVYYIEKLENECDSDHILYCYKDGVSTEIMNKEMLHVYFFDTYSVYYHDMNENNYEEIYTADLNVENAERLAILKDSSNGDMNGFIGALGDKVMLNTAGWVRSPLGAMRQNIYTDIEISRKRLNAYQDPKKAPDYEVTNILYEEEVQLVKASDGTYSFTATPNKNTLDHIINIPEHDASMLETNMNIVGEYRPGDEEFYSDEEVVVELDNLWYYSSPTLNVTIEKVYDENIETLIFVTNIRTNDPSEFKLGYSTEEPPGKYTLGVKTDNIAQINKAVFATNGDFAMFSQNNWVGKVIRNGRIFDGLKKGAKEYKIEDVYDTKSNCKDFLAYYPDGTMEAYTIYDEITYGELIDAGVEYTLSFGPILVRDSEKTSACIDPSYYISGANPRCAWGMVEPGHYVNVVAEGRQPSVSRGMSFYTMSDYFQKKGCSVAYNLDGGQTAAISFLGRFLNTHQNDVMYKNHRPVQEIIYFGTSDLVPGDLQNYYEE